ncbi:MAG TPA: ATP-binding protein [Vicinamibacterales bacterium]
MSDRAAAVDPVQAATLRWLDELSEEGIFTTDTQLVVRSWNRFMSELTGVQPEAAIGQPLLDLLPELAERRTDAHYRAALAGEARVLAHRFHRYLVADRGGAGEPAQSARITPLEHDGAIIGTLTVISDVSERIASERELRSRIEFAETARAIAEDAVRVKDEFLATLSHEIRTPLNAVLGWTKILLARPLDQALTTRALQIIDRNASAQTRLIDDMLDMARIMSGKLRLETQPVDLAAIAGAAIDVVAPTAAVKGLTLVADIGTARPWMMGDADRLQQIVWNLLSNAIKFTERGGTITLSLARDNAWLTLRVSDTGRGIEADFLPQIFERFRQADASASRRHGGLGLGLPLVRTLTELHGGSVSASSEPGRGSAFTVTFPGRTELTDAESMAAVAADADRVLPGVRVLLVEDQQDSRDMIVAALQHYGVDVTEAGTSREALESLDAALAAHRPPAAIISDIGLPGEDGFHLMELLRARPPSRGGGIPVIAVTAYGHPQDKRRALAAGFSLHLTKPVDPGELASALAGIIRSRG